MRAGCSGGELAIGFWPLAIGLKIFDNMRRAAFGYWPLAVGRRASSWGVSGMM